MNRRSTGGRQMEGLVFYTYCEAAKKLGVSESAIRKWVANGIMRHHKLGGRLVRFTDEDLLSAFRVVEPMQSTATPPRRQRTRRRPS
ncbi:helix-turn-helix domain-containing protein [Dactylosporangium sp. NPDC049742]|uniref:helix-turn-helix domain-containing protein n=1 Tax=Dactylosporangium sp. NPDC049742 TaxID=3154737 RepID=UPI003444205E